MAEGVFSGKRALVVGGTGGIGRAVALGLAERGAYLTVHGGSSGERLENTLKAIREKGGKAEGFLLPIDNSAAADKIFAISPNPDILVCSYGPFNRREFDKTDTAFWQRVVDLNLIFPGALVSLFIGAMMERNWGRILLFGGTNTDTIRGFTSTAAYSAAKTALGVIAKSAAKSASSMGVTCNVLCPGLTDTEYSSEDMLRYNREKSPGGKTLKAAQIAAAGLAILENPCLNGGIIPADQGVTL